MEDEESGLDELMRLSQQFTRQKEDQEEQERAREEKGKQVRGVLQGLKDLNISMAVQQLKSVAPPEIIDEVNTLSNKDDTDDLRKMISSLADNMEKQLNSISSSSPDAEPLVNSMRTLSILMDLYFSLH
jgi:cysteinyl-tRNA synthetase